MNIAILVNSMSISGGNNVLLEHAGNLMDRGHSVVMLLDGEVDPGKAAWHRNAARLRWMALDAAQGLFFDVAIASFWRTCYDMPRIDARHYAYFNQSVESRFYPEDDAYQRSFSELAYVLGFDIVTEARWIQEYIRERYGIRAYLVPNGVRKDVFTEEGFAQAPREPGKLRLLVEGPLDVGFKNVRRTIELCREGGADEVWLLTSSLASSVQGVDRVFSRIPIHETPPVYRSCDAIIKLSYIEGMFGPPLEMFHCGGTAVVYDVTGHEEYIRHGENSLVAKKGDEAAVISFIKDLKADSGLLARLKSNAVRTAKLWIDWSDSTDLLEAALREINGKPEGNATTVRTRASLVASLASSASADVEASFEAAFMKLPLRRFLGLAKRYIAGKIRRKTGRFA
jgi:O-antigen biosynthesis protein